MANDSFDSVTLLKSFAEAGNALEALPKVRADLEAAQALIDETNERLKAEQDLVQQRDAELASLRATLAQREADLTSATFRNEQSQKLLQGLRGLLGSDRDSDRSVQPEVTQAPAPTQEGQSDMDPTSDGAITDTKSTVGTPDVWPNGDVHHNSERSEDQPHTQPTEVANSAIQPNPSAPHADSPATNSGTSAEAHPADSTGVEGQRDSGFTTAPYASQTTADPATAAGNGASVNSPKLYADARPGDKPWNVTWAEFVAGGGHAPLWMADPIHNHNT